MGEYEHAILFIEFAQAASAAMANYITLVFAMVVASYLAAHRLDKLMSGIAILIYSMFALGYCNEIIQIYSDLSNLGIAMEDRFGGIPESSLGWLGPVRAGSAFLEILPFLIGTMVLLAYAASIWFFFRARKLHKQGTPTPLLIPAEEEE